MANVVVDDLTLKEIADAIRMKNGLDNTYMPSEMPAAIRRLCGGIDPEMLKLGGNLKEYDKDGLKSWMFNEYGDQITYTPVTNSERMFYNAKNIKKAPWFGYAQESMFENCTNLETVEVEYDGIDDDIKPSRCSLKNMFKNCHSLKTLKAPLNKSIGSLDYGYDNNNYYTYIDSTFENCYNLESITGKWKIYLYKNFYYGKRIKLKHTFKNCYALKEIDDSFLTGIFLGSPTPPNSRTVPIFVQSFSSISSSIGETDPNGMFDGCLSLRSINMGYTTTVHSQSYYPYDLYGNSFNRCAMLSRIHFGHSVNDCYYTGFTIDLTTCGYASTPEDAAILEGLYGPPVTTDEEYAAHKNDPDWWTNDPKYSRYNLESALDTAKVVPTMGKGCYGSIKFKKNAGSNTDGGGINFDTQPFVTDIAPIVADGWSLLLEE